MSTKFKEKTSSEI